MLGNISTQAVSGNRKRKIRSFAFAMLVGMYCSAATAMPAFAENAGASEIISGITNGTGQLWNILVAIVAPIGAVALAIQVVKIIWGGPRAAEEAKSAAIKIVIAIAVVLMAPVIINAVRGWFTAGSWSFGE